MHHVFNINQATTDEEGVFIPIESVSYRSAEYVESYNNNLAGTSYDSRVVLAQSGGGTELSPLSFQFQNQGSYWQAAAVSNLIMSIQIAGQPGSYKQVNFSIEVGVPRKSGKTTISSAYAAQQAAWAANQAAVIVGGMYAAEYFNPGTSTASPKQFAATMQGFLNTEIPGARVTSPPTSPDIVPTPAIMVPSSWWDIFFGK